MTNSIVLHHLRAVPDLKAFHLLQVLKVVDTVRPEEAAEAPAASPSPGTDLLSKRQTKMTKVINSKASSEGGNKASNIDNLLFE